VEEEEAGEAEGADRRQLLLELCFRPWLVLGLGPVTLGQQRATELRQLAIDPWLLFPRVAVAELAAEIELEPLGDAQGLDDRVGMVGEALRHLPRRGQGGAAIAAAQRLGLLQRHPQSHSDEDVLQKGAPLTVRVDVAGGDGGHTQALGQPGEPPVASAIAAPKGPLQLKPEAVRPEGTQEPPGGLRSPRRIAPLPGGGKHSRAGASREANQPLSMLFELLDAHRRLAGAALRGLTRVGVRSGEEPTEVAVAARVFDQQGEVRVLGRAMIGWGNGRGHSHRHLRSRDRPDLSLSASFNVLAGLDELHRAPDPLVVGQGEALIAEIRSGGGQLARRRGPVEEGEGRVSVQLDVGRGARHQPRCRYQRLLTMLRKTTRLRPSASASSK
jgi:hypothetical protein